MTVSILFIVQWNLSRHLRQKADCIIGHVAHIKHEKSRTKNPAKPRSKKPVEWETPLSGWLSVARCLGTFLAPHCSTSGHFDHRVLGSLITVCRIVPSQRSPPEPQCSHEWKALWWLFWQLRPGLRCPVITVVPGSWWSPHHGQPGAVLGHGQHRETRAHENNLICSPHSHSTAHCLTLKPHPVLCPSQSTLNKNCF